MITTKPISMNVSWLQINVVHGKWHAGHFPCGERREGGADLQCGVGPHCGASLPEVWACIACSAYQMMRMKSPTSWPRCKMSLAIPTGACCNPQHSNPLHLSPHSSCLLNCFCPGWLAGCFKYANNSFSSDGHGGIDNKLAPAVLFISHAIVMQLLLMAPLSLSSLNGVNPRLKADMLACAALLPLSTTSSWSYRLA